ncbi:MAG: aldehyde dehydrogenase family protein, partial [Gammaproteobacteria bacterium]
MQTDFTHVFVTGDKKPAGMLEVHAPYDGKLLATIATAGSSQIEQALASAYELFRNKQARLPLPERISILEKLQNFMLLHQEELAVGAAAEGGKPLIDSRVEVSRAIDGVKICIQTLRTDAGHVIPMDFNAGSANRMAFTQYEPIGVVVAISAFNHPVNLIIHQVVPAVASGCPVIVKPSAETPLSCLRIVSLLYEAGLPAEWCQALIIPDNDLATKLVTDSRVAFLSFIGSARVGWTLRSKLAAGTRCALEHGGVAPVFVAADADIDVAVNSITKGGFYHAGQVCVSVQRIFVHQDIVKPFAEKLANKAKSLVIGD